MDVELWKDIKDYEGLYQVSNFGRVKSLERVGKNKKYIKNCILSPRKDRYGYLRVWLYKDGFRVEYSIHRLVAKAFISNPDNKPRVNHKDGIKAHNEDYNIEWATNSENQKHSFRELGNVKVGEENNQAKLTRQQVLRIRSLVVSTKPKELAVMFNISSSTIYDIKKRRSWKHI